MASSSRALISMGDKIAVWFTFGQSCMHTFHSTITAFVLLLAAAAPPAWGADSALKPRTFHRKPPPLVLLDRAGKRHSLEEYRGKVVLVNFFGIWCPSCLQEMPSLLFLATALEDQPFMVLAVDVGDSLARLRQVFGEQRKAFAILLDSTRTAARTWRVQGFPTTFVLDPEGRIRYSAEGPVQWDDLKIAKQIAALLPKPPSHRDSNAGSGKNAGSGNEPQVPAPQSDGTLR